MSKHHNRTVGGSNLYESKIIKRIKEKRAVSESIMKRCKREASSQKRSKRKVHLQERKGFGQERIVAHGGIELADEAVIQKRWHSMAVAVSKKIK